MDFKKGLFPIILAVLIAPSALAQISTPCDGTINQCRQMLAELPYWASKIVTMQGPSKVYPYQNRHDAARDHYFLTLSLKESGPTETINDPNKDGYMRTALVFNFDVIGTPPNKPSLDKTKTITIFTNNGSENSVYGTLISYEDDGYPIFTDTQYQAWVDVKMGDDGNYVGSFPFGWGGIYTTHTITAELAGIAQEVKILVPENEESQTNPMGELETPSLRALMHEYTPHTEHREVPPRKISNTLTRFSAATEAEPAPTAPAPCTACKNYGPFWEIPQTQNGERLKLNIAFEPGASDITSRMQRALTSAIAIVNKSFVVGNELVNTGIEWSLVPSSQQTDITIKIREDNEDKEMQVIQNGASRTILVQAHSTLSFDNSVGMWLNALGRIMGAAETTAKNCRSMMQPVNLNNSQANPNDMTLDDVLAVRAANNPNRAERERNCKKARGTPQRTTQGGGGEIVFAPDPPRYVHYPVCNTYAWVTDWYACLPAAYKSIGRVEFLPACTYEVVGSTWSFVTTCN